MRLPRLYTKKDGAYYFTFHNKQYYAGKTLDRAERKLRDVTGSRPNGGTCLITLVGRYLDSLVGCQSPDTIYGKAIVYRQLLSYLGRIPVNGRFGPGIHSLHDSSGVADRYTCYGEAFGQTFHGSVQIELLSAENLRKYQQSLLKQWKKTSVKSAFIKIQALCSWLHEGGFLSTNPCTKVVKIKIAEELRPDCLTEEEVGKLFQLVGQGTQYAKVRDRLLFGLTIYAGLRRIECTRLKWTDLDLEQRVLVVRNGKGGKNRLVAINDRLYELFITSERFGEYVLSSESGAQVTRGALGQVTQRYVKKLNHQYQGKRRFALHSLRATFATRLCEKGVSTRIVQELLGHSDPRTTLRYAAVSQAAALDAVQRL